MNKRQITLQTCYKQKRRKNRSGKNNQIQINTFRLTFTGICPPHCLPIYYFFHSTSRLVHLSYRLVYNEGSGTLENEKSMNTKKFGGVYGNTSLLLVFPFTMFLVCCVYNQSDGTQESVSCVLSRNSLLQGVLIVESGAKQNCDVRK